MKTTNTFLALVIVAFLFLYATAYGQLTGTKNIPGDYATLAAAITDLNTQGVGGGGVIFNVAAGHTETLTARLNLTATGTAANQIIFQKSGTGANPLITAYTGTTTPGSATPDGMWALVGSDYVTIDGINLFDPNTTNPASMEYGYGLFKASVSDGAQNNTIKNCVVTLNRVNNASGTLPMVEGSVGILVINSIPTAAITGLTITIAAGTNSFNKFYTNTIQNCNYGIALSGFAAASPFTAGDTNNDIGGSSSATGNTILNFGGGGSAGNAAGIRANNQWGINISYNSINNNDGGGVNHATTLRGIFAQAGTSANATIDNNTVIVRSGATTSACTAIDNGIGSTAAANTVTINNNTIQIGYPTATTGVYTGINNSATAATVNINGNNITQISAVALAGTGTHVMIETGSPVSVTTNNNTISNINRNGASGSWRGIKTTSPTNWTCNGNTIENLSWTAAASTGSIDAIFSLSSAVNVTANNNIIRNLSTPATGTITGIREFGAAGTKIFNNNQIYSFSTTAGGAGGATFYGIHSSIGNIELSNNIVYSLNSSGSTGGTGGVITGLWISAGTTNIVFKNKIYGLSTTSTTSTSGAVNGILISGGTTNTMYNNLVGDLRATASAAVDAIRGISITSTTTSSTINVYYNTIFLNATSTGTNFGTSGIFHTANATSTTAALNLRNNIIVNNSTSAGTGLTVAYRRSGTGTALANYASTSNNNDFFAPTIMHDGTTAYTISTYKTLVAPRDVASFSENPEFQSVTGSSADFLKYTVSSSKQIESGAANIATYTDDYIGTVRQGNTGYAGTGTAPDVGAWELEGQGLDLAPPAISYTTLGNGVAGTNRSFTNVVITDASGVNVDPNTRPRVYYKKTTDGNDGTGWKFVEASGGGGSPFSFTIDYTLLNDGSVTEGNTIQYFVVAQDLSPAVNVGINSGVFNARQTSVALQSDAFPITGTINSFNIVASISGVVTVGTAGTYPTLTGAGGLFADINAKVVTGNITVNIISDITEGGVNAINQWAEEPANSNFTITIQPSDAAMRTISGSFAGGLIRLNGADRVTIDGRFSGAGNFLTFSNTSTSSSAVFMLISLGAGQGATNNTIRNCNISTGTSSIATYGIHLGGSTIASSGADNDNNSILNNVITVASHGIYAFGTASSSSGGLDNLTISGNSVTCNTSVQSIGIRLSNMLNSTVSQNTLDIRQSAPNAPVAISLETGVNNTTVSGNLVTRSAYTGVSGYGGRGIVVGTGMASSNITLVNNVIYGVTGDNHSSFSNSSSMGIAIGVSGSTGTLTTTTGGVNIYSNSVHMYNTYTKATACLTAAIYIGSGASNLNIRNNVFANKMDNLENTTSKSYAIYSAAGASAFSNINYNDYFASGPEGVLGFLTSDRADLTEWRTATGQDVNSIAANPMFTSDTDLRPGVGSPVLASGTPISGITTDYLGVTRNATNPTIGAYETGVDFSGPAISYTALGNTSSTANRTLSSVTITDVSGVDFGSNKPRIYFKKSTSDNVFGGNTSTDNGWKWTEANTGSSPTDFTIDYSKLLGGSVSIGDTVQFFVVAQDLAGTPYVSSSPSTGFAGISVSSITSAPTTPNQYKIVGVPLAGDYTVGLGFFKSISGLDIEFNQVVEKKFKDVFVENTNLQIEKGINKEDVNRELVSIKEIGTPPEVKTGLNLSGTYELREVEEVTWIPMLNGQVYEGPLYVKKSENPGLQFPEGIEGVYATITAAIADLNERGVSGPTSFTLVNAAYPTETYPITIDVTNENVPSATNTVTIRPASGLGVTVSGSSAVALFRLNGADFIRIDGLNTGGSSLTLVNANAGTSSAVIWIGSKSSTNGATNNIVRNCTIVGNAPTTTLAGIVSSSGTTVGSVAEAPNSNNTYQNNIIRKSSFGIAVVGPTGNETGLLINGNTIGSTVGSDKIGFNGIAVFQQQNAVISNNTIMGVVTATSSTTAGIRVAGTANGILINANSISDVKNTNTGGFSAIGISLNSSSIPANVSVTNNLIWDVAGHGWETFITDNGYGINILSGGGYNLYFNSVNLATNQTLTTGLPACLIINSVVTTANTLDIRNNIFSIPATVGTNRYAVISNAANTVFSNLDNNVYFTSGTNLGYSGGTNRANLTAWRTWSVRDVNSIAANPMFTAEANLQPLTGSPLALAGTAISGITTDITGITRHATTPTIGAFEALASASASNNIPAGNTSPVSFPGTGTTIQFTVGNTGSVDLTIAVIHSGPGGTLPSGLVNIAPQYWAATVTSGTVTGTYSLTLDITGVPGVGNAATLRLLKRDNASSSWVNLGVPTTISGNLLTWAGLTSFSDFGLGGESENPLPVELSTFAAVVKKRDVLLTWETQTEMNAHSFEVQRSLQEGIWSKVGEVMAHGNSNSPKQYSLSDTKLNSGQYSYRLKMIDNDGVYEYSKVVAAEISNPKEYALSQNYPNPFNPSTKIEYQLPFDANVTIELYGITGEKIADLIKTEQAAGFYTLDVNGNSLNLTSGVYIYRMVATGKTDPKAFVSVKKMLMLK